MVVKIMWTNSWVVVSISVCVLVILIVILLLCVCWKRDGSTQEHQFYILDENGLQKLNESADSGSTDGMFRRFSNAALAFASNNFKQNELFPANIQRKKSISINNELLDSLDFNEQFNNAVLRIDINDKLNLLDEEVKSCISDGSHHSFYSVAPASPSSMKSICSSSDNSK